MFATNLLPLTQNLVFSSLSLSSPTWMRPPSVRQLSSIELPSLSVAVPSQVLPLSTNTTTNEARTCVAHRRASSRLRVATAPVY